MIAKHTLVRPSQASHTPAPHHHPAAQFGGASDHRHCGVSGNSSRQIRDWHGDRRTRDEQRHGDAAEDKVVAPPPTPRTATPLLLRSTMWAQGAARAFTKRSLPASFSFRILHSVRMASTLPKIPIFEAVASHNPKSTAIVHSLSGRSFTYGELLNDVAAAKDKLAQNTNGKATQGERIAFLVENGYDYVGALNSTLKS